MRTMLSLLFVFCLAIGLSPSVCTAEESPLAEKYLLDGKLTTGAMALQGWLKEAPNDDQVRFGLGVLQFLQTFEHLGGSLHKYGLRTEKFFLRPLAQVKEFFAQNPQVRDSDIKRGTTSTVATGSPIALQDIAEVKNLRNLDLDFTGLQSDTVGNQGHPFRVMSDASAAGPFKAVRERSREGS